MPDFKLADAVSAMSGPASNIVLLWTVYAAATFATAGYRVPGRGGSLAVIIAVTLGFWLFAIGHLALVIEALRVSIAFAEDIHKSLAAVAGQQGFYFKNSLDTLVWTTSPLWPSVTLHLVIDVCVTIALWGPRLTFRKV